MYAPAPGFIPPCLPTIAKQALTGPVYEIEHDGYRLMVRRAEQCLYIFSRSAHCRGGSPIAREVFLLDGEGIVTTAGGMPNFRLLHGRLNAAAASLIALGEFKIARRHYSSD
jgi:ATP-dependent DNA ligase